MTDEVFYDIETLMPWQKDLVTGIRKGEMTIMMSGRQAGKSSAVAYQRLWQAIMEGDTRVHDMRLGEGTVYGSRYYTVEPVGGNWLEMESWCVKTFGEGSRALWGEQTAPEPARRWYANNRKFWFRTEKDRDWFIVMWRA